MTEHGMVAGDDHIGIDYVRIGNRSWHIQRKGWPSLLLCGKRASAHPDPSNPLDHQASGWRSEDDPPPMDERTCEVCLRILAAHRT